MSTELIVEERVTVQPVEPGDHDKMAHYVDKNQLMVATIEGLALEALCGKIWVPTRDAKNFPVCQQCKEVYEQMKNE